MFDVIASKFYDLRLIELNLFFILLFFYKYEAVDYVNEEMYSLNFPEKFNC